MIAVPEKYALEVNSPTSIKSERQHEQYLSVLDELASKDSQTSEEEKSGLGPPIQHRVEVQATVSCASANPSSPDSQYIIFWPEDR